MASKGSETTDEEVLDAFPGTRVDPDNIGYYRGLMEHRLVLNRCDDCGHWHQPPRPICPKCWSWSVTPTAVRGEGTVAIVTVLRQGPPQPGVDYTNGHAVIAVDLDEQVGLRISGGVVGTAAESVQIGDRVRVLWRDLEGAPPRADFEVIP